MGLLGDAIAAAPKPKIGAPHQLPLLIAALPDDEARDEFRALVDSGCPSVKLRRAFYTAYPDMPYHPESTWHTWLSQWRTDGRRF